MALLDNKNFGVALGAAKSSPDEAAGGKFAQFINTLKTYGVSRRNRYVVEMTLPTSDKIAMDRPTSAMIGVYATDVELPTKEVYTDRSRIYGTNVEMPSDYQFGLTFDITFYVDASYKAVSMFDRWVDLVVRPLSNDIGYHKDYVGTVVVSIIDYSIANDGGDNNTASIVDEAAKRFASLNSIRLNKESPSVKTVDSEIARYTYLDAYPKAIKVKRLSNDAKDYQEVTITFAYRKVVPFYAYGNAERLSPRIDVTRKSGLLSLLPEEIGGSLIGNIDSAIGAIKKIGG